MEPDNKTIDVPVTIKVPENSPLQRLVNPHKLKSRKVTEADMERVAEEAKILNAICFETKGFLYWSLCYASLTNR